MTTRHALLLAVCFAGAAHAQDRERVIYQNGQASERSIKISATNNRGVTVYMRGTGESVLGYYSPAEVRSWLDGPVETYVTAESLYKSTAKPPRGEKMTEYSASLGRGSTISLRRVTPVPPFGLGDEFTIVGNDRNGYESVYMSISRRDLRKALDAFRLAAVVADSMAVSGRPVNSETALLDVQVDKPAAPANPRGQPRFPAALRATGVEGQVVLKFVVDTLGRADLATAEMVRSDHVLFTAAAVEFLATMQFIPAEVGGRKVRQLVQYPFIFAR